MFHFDPNKFIFLFNSLLQLPRHFVEHHQSAKNRTQNILFGPRAIKMKESVGGELTRASRTSITRSASLRRSRMAREAAAMWPGNQLTTPPPALNAISPARFAARVSPLMLGRRGLLRVGAAAPVRFARQGARSL
jgi:hypothetical protein